jgi:hypothetical protein
MEPSGVEDDAVPRANPIAPSRSPGGTASPSVIALAERLRLHPQILADELGDANGEIPAPSAERLERGFTTAGALARRLGLDEGRSQSLVSLITFYVFSVLREEKMSAPGGADPARLEELTTSLLRDIRAACGDDAADAAERELARL